MKSAIAKLSCLVVVIGLSLSLYASTPSSASLSPTAGATVSWTGTDKGGASTDESTCVDGVNCDAFTLNLSGTPSNWAIADASTSVGCSLLLSIQLTRRGLMISSSFLRY